MLQCSLKLPKEKKALCQSAAQRDEGECVTILDSDKLKTFHGFKRSKYMKTSEI